MVSQMTVIQTYCFYYLNTNRVDAAVLEYKLSKPPAHKLDETQSALGRSCLRRQCVGGNGGLDHGNAVRHRAPLRRTWLLSGAHSRAKDLYNRGRLTCKGMCNRIIQSLIREVGPMWERAGLPAPWRQLGAHGRPRIAAAAR